MPQSTRQPTCARRTTFRSSRPSSAGFFPSTPRFPSRRRSCSDGRRSCATPQATSAARRSAPSAPAPSSQRLSASFTAGSVCAPVRAALPRHSLIFGSRMALDFAPALASFDPRAPLRVLDRRLRDLPLALLGRLAASGRCVGCLRLRLMAVDLSLYVLPKAAESFWRTCVEVRKRLS